MKPLQNLHTHTSYCDGADTPEEIIIAALEKGFTSIGFSQHSYLPYSPTLSQRGDRSAAYRKAISQLKEKYHDQMEIFCGLEVDRYSQVDLSGYDYLIGAVHYLMCGDTCVGFDRSETVVESVIQQYFGGCGIQFAKAYYRTLATLPELGKFDIIGHFDLVAKHSHRQDFFDTTSKAYMHAAIEAAEALAGKIPFFEVNTGGIARGYRADPYPSIPIIKELKRLGFGAVITSDCHNKQMLDCHFDQAAQILKCCGYEEKYILTEQGFVAVAL